MLDYTQLLISYGLPLLFPLVIGSMGTCVLLSAKKARFVPHFLLGVYICCLCYVTLCRASVYDSSVHFQVFSAWRLAWNTFSFQNWANLLLNVALLWPFGILFPLVFQKIKKWTVPAGLVLSLLIESLQLLTHRGIFDVDDLLCNTVGCAMGFGLLYFCQNIRRSPRRAWAGAVPALLPLLFFLAVFEPTFARFRLAAVIVAASFATFENVCYLTQNGADQILFLLIRGFGTGAMHVVCGNVYGGVLRPVWDSRPLRAACLFALLCVAIIYHAIYNLLVSAGGTPQLIAYFVPLPTALCFRLLARKAEA